MEDYVKYLGYQVKYLIRRIDWKIRGKSILKYYANRNVLSIEDGNIMLAEKLQSGNSLMVTRYGYNEIQLFMDASIKKKIDSTHLKRMCDFAGFFPCDEEVANEYGKIMESASKEIDVCALYYCPGEEYTLSTFCPNAELVVNRAIEPWYSISNPWSQFLQGKKVLVIHPFEDDIIAQYTEREKIFPGTDLLPSFDLKTLKAVQTIAGQVDPRFSTWIDALDYMTQEAAKIDFDVALIGCGAYGLPLAANIKKMGKQAIHLGGALQLLFGIKGARWDNHPQISKLYNDSWVRPSESNKPRNASNVEGGCYW